MSFLKEDTSASALSTSSNPSSEYVKGNEDIEVESIDSLQAPVLEFDTGRPDLFKANGPIEFYFGSLPLRTQYMEYMDNTTNCHIDLFPPDFPLSKDVLHQDSSTTNYISQLPDDAQDLSNSSTDVLTIADFKRIIEDFIHNFSLGPLSISPDGIVP